VNDSQLRDLFLRFADEVWEVRIVTENFVATVEDVIPVLPAGIYPAQFAGIETQTNDNGTFWLWRFLAHDGNNNVEVTATTSPRITPRTKAAKYLAGLGVVAKVGEQVDFLSLIEQPCQLVIVINDAGYSRIDNVLPFVNKAKAK